MRANSIAKQTNYLIFIVVGVYLVFQLLFQFFFGRLWIDKNLYLLLVFFQLIIILLPALVFLYYHKSEDIFCFKRKGITPLEALLVIMMTIAASLIASVLNSVVFYLLEKIGSVSTDNVPAPGNVSELWIQIVVIALLPAVCEELFFRGVIFGAFRGMGFKWAMVISAFYFALFHFDIRNLLGPFFLGILLAWYCYRTGSIIAGMLAHFTNNMLAVLVSWYNRDVQADYMQLTSSMMGELLVLAIVVGFVFLIMAKAFLTITEKKVKVVGNQKNISPSILLHWPMLIVYAAYVVIMVLFLISLTKPLV